MSGTTPTSAAGSARAAREDWEWQYETKLVVQARFAHVDGRFGGVGRWRVYYRVHGMRWAKRCAGDLVPSCWVRVMDGRECVAGPMRASELADA